MNTYTRYFLFVAALLNSCYYFPLLGQEVLSFRHIDSKEGLSQNSVFAIAQDGDGFMWFGTRDGLNRYDGYRIRNYRSVSGADSANSLIHNDIRTIYYDVMTNGLWIGTRKGLSFYNPESDDFRNYIVPDHSARSTSREVTRMVFRDSQGNLWLGTDGGLYRYHDTKDEFLRCNSPKIYEKNTYFDVNVIFEDAQKQLWIGSTLGIYQIEVVGEEQVFYLPRPEGEAVQKMFAHNMKRIVQDREGYYWFVSLLKGVFRWKPGEVPVHYQQEPNNPQSINHNDVRTLGVDLEGRVWIGTFQGINIFDSALGHFRSYTHEANNPRSIANNSVRSMYFDAQGSVWVGTYYGGVSHYNPKAYRFTHHEPKMDGKGLSSAVISSFWEDESGNLWIGTEGGGLNYWDRKGDHYTHFQYMPNKVQGIGGNNVKCLQARGDSLWIGTFSSGLDLYNLRTKTWKHFRHDESNPHSISNDNVYSLLLEGGQLWIATYGGGLNKLDLTSGEIEVYVRDEETPYPLNSNLNRVLIKDQQERIWLGTNEGLDLIESKASGELIFHNIIADKPIYSLLAAQNGNIWVGTFNHGLIELTPDGSIRKHYNKGQGMPGHSIFGLLEDERGNIWVSTEKGIARIDPALATVTDYNSSDGIDNVEHNFNAYYETRSGEMLFGGVRGFTSFFPEQIIQNAYVPPLVFTHLKSFNEPVEPNDAHELLDFSINHTEHLVFPYNRASFSLGFSALDYLNPENNHYSYQLLGLDLDWKNAQGESEVNYTLQRSGEYIFRLKGGNNDGTWNPQERILRITVLPPFWRSNTAYLIYFILIVLILIAGYRFVQMQHRLRLEKVTKEQQAELHQAKMRFYTNIAHEFRTPLTLIRGPIEELIHKGAVPGGERQLQVVMQNSQRLLRLVNQLLNFRSMEQDHTQLQVMPGDIVKFLREVYQSFQEQARRANISYHFDHNEEHTWLWYDADKLEKVFYNLLSNAFKFTPDGGRISVQIYAEAHTVQVHVCDSGPGIPEALKEKVFERFYHREVDEQNPQNSTGIGLALSKQMIEMHGGELRLSSTVSPYTCFQVRLRKGKAHIDPENLVEAVERKQQVTTYLEQAFAGVEAREEQLYVEMALANQDKDQLLIVEDNTSIRDYILGIFEPYYKVLLAENGKAGLQMALSHLPDLIISDVMMPEMDGIKLCKELKSQIETSHIPLILLTAHSEEVLRVEGLQTGADAYLTKPFSPYELQLKVKNLLAARQRIRDRFHSVLRLEPGEITVTSADELFISKALEVVEDHMENANFNVELFAHEMAVSRPLLFTKLKGITNQTPNNFVKSLRLKRSAQLLTQSDLGVAEIAYKVGFRNARYFSKCFQKEFAQTPKEYRLSYEIKAV